jgi:hypothetical protein
MANLAWLTPMSPKATPKIHSILGDNNKAVNCGANHLRRGWRKSTENRQLGMRCRNSNGRPGLRQSSLTILAGTPILHSRLGPSMSGTLASSHLRISVYAELSVQGNLLFAELARSLLFGWFSRSRSAPSDHGRGGPDELERLFLISRNCRFALRSAYAILNLARKPIDIRQQRTLP